MTTQIERPPGIAHLLDCFPSNIAQALGTLSAKDWAKLEEIRLLAQRPILLYQEGGSTFLTPSGAFTNSAERAVFVTIQQIAAIFRQLCENSVYAKEEDIRQGFLSLPGGHRAGICGSATVHNGEVTFIKNISALNIRIAHQAIGCASGVMQHICSGGMLHNTILVSPPGGGKTTLLRDIARILGATYKVGIADERGEIAAVYKGIAQNDIGLRSVVMDSCPKATAMGLMIRSMGVECVITDEIGSMEDAHALHLASCAGVHTIATVHGAGLEDLQIHPHLKSVLPLFEYVIFLQKSSGSSRIKQIICTKEQ